jgi:putative transposase
MHTMTKRQGKSRTIDIKAVLAEDEESLRALVRMALQEVLEADMTEALGAEKGERASGRQGYRSGYYGRTLITRVGKLELRVPQDRTGRFSTELFERYQRSERALVAALAEMYVQGVSTRKVKAITEELCGHSFSASSISAMNQQLDASLAQFASRALAEAFPYLILDARYERVREAGVIVSQAVLIAIGIDWDGRRQVLAVELANRESRSSWRDFLLGLRARGLHDVEFVVADDHAGLRAALREVLAEAAYQRCYVHFLRDALDYVPRRADIRPHRPAGQQCRASDELQRARRDLRRGMGAQLRGRRSRRRSRRAPACPRGPPPLTSGRRATNLRPLGSCQIELLERTTQSGRRYENGDAAAQRLGSHRALR